jgi:hypothetical protein
VPVHEQGKFRQEGVELTNAVIVRCGNLGPLHEQLADEIAVAVDRVLKSAWYVLSPEVAAFERAFANYHNVGFCRSQSLWDSQLPT